MAKLNYRAVAEKENHNISRINPWVKLGKYSLYIAGILLLLFLITIAGGRLLVPLISLEQEREWFGDEEIFEYFGDPSPSLSEKVQVVLDRLDRQNPDRFDYRATVICNDEINALTAFGGEIAVFSGLLERIDSENELSYVLAHELSHVKHRDVLKKGVTELPFAILQILFAEVPVGPLKNTIASGFDKNIELRSDREAVELLMERYGHIGGAAEFMQKMQGDTWEEMMTAFSGHPMTATRVRRLEEVLQDHPDGETTPLGFSVGEECD